MATRLGWLILVTVLLGAWAKQSYEYKAELRGLESILMTCLRGGTLSINGSLYGCQLEQRSAI